jgi:hypothetical protein
MAQRNARLQKSPRKNKIHKLEVKSTKFILGRIMGFKSDLIDDKEREFLVLPR